MRLYHESEPKYLHSFQILKALKALPVQNKTMLKESKILSVVEKWSQLTEDDVGVPEAPAATKDVKENGNDADSKTSGSSTPVSSGDVSVKTGAVDSAKLPEI